MKLIAAIFCLGLAACATPQEKPKLPYWIDGVSNVCSMMADKNIYWLAKIDSGTVTQGQMIELLRSEKRQWVNVKTYIEHQKYMYYSGLDDAQ